MNALTRTLALVAMLAVVLPARELRAAEETAAQGEGTELAELPPEARAYYEALGELAWVRGPTTVDVAGNSRLVVPEGYIYLDEDNTDRYLELNQNLASGREVMVAPEGLDWVAYMSYSDEGYVKDDEQIDAPALLEALQEGAKQDNQERRRRGWSELNVLDWAVAPAYNTVNKRLEWATLLESDGGRSANFSTKVLSRRGHTSVILVAAPEDLAAARPELDTLLGGYGFVDGERYADFRPGDKVATYGLAALVLGGAAAIASKKGLWAVMGAFIISKIKIIIGAVALVGVAVRRFISGKTAGDAH